MKLSLDPFEEVLADVRAGRPIVLVDDEDRENEGDLMVAAERVLPETISFMMNHGKGLICISVTEARRRELGIPLQTSENTSAFHTNFAVSFDHRSVADFGSSARARARTILEAAAPRVDSRDFVTPGYVFPVCAVAGGVLKRRGQTEGSVDLSRLAGLEPVGVICEIMGTDGQMLRGKALSEYCRTHQLKVSSVEAIVQHRLLREVSVRRVAELELTPAMGIRRAGIPEDLFARLKGVRARAIFYVDDVDDKEHFAIVIGEPAEQSLVRVHSECLTGDVFESLRCDCGHQLNQALTAVFSAHEGVVVYLHQEGRGIGLGNKLRAYELQDRGFDTVDANLELGFAPDERNYRVAAQILRDIGVCSARLMTNNPEKVRAMESFGIQIAERVPLAAAYHAANARYLETKRKRMGHLIPERKPPAS